METPNAGLNIETNDCDVEYRIIKDPYYIIRNIFYNATLTEYEEKKYKLFLEKMQKDNSIFNKFNKFRSINIYNDYLNNKEDSLRILNLFQYDVEFAITNLIKMSELMNKLKIKILRGEQTSILEEFISNSKWIKFLDNRDKKQRPIVGINFSSLLDFLNINFIKNSTTSAVLNTFLFFMNKLLDKYLIPGKVEQFNLFINMDNLDDNFKIFTSYVEDVLKIFQYSFASKVNRVFVLADSKESYVTFLNFNKYIFESNKEKIEIFKKNKINKSNQPYDCLDTDINIETFKQYFMENINVSNNNKINEKIISNKSINYNSIDDDEVNQNILRDLDFHFSHIRAKYSDKCLSSNESLEFEIKKTKNKSHRHNENNTAKDILLDDELKNYKILDNSFAKKFESVNLIKDHFEVNIYNSMFNDNKNNDISNSKSEIFDKKLTNVSVLSIQNNVNNFSINNSHSNFNVENRPNLKLRRDEFQNLILNSSNNINYNFINKGIKTNMVSQGRPMSNLPVDNNQFVMIIDKPRGDVCCSMDPCVIF